MNFIVKSGTLVTAGETYCADILVQDGKIIQIGRELVIDGATVIDAHGRYVLPGGVDVHAHLELPMFGTISSDDHYSGHKAAAFGGTTTVLDFIPQDLQPLQANIDLWHEKASRKAAVDYGFHMNISTLNDRVSREITHLVQEGITSIKVFTAYNDRLRLQDGDIFKALRVAGNHGLLTMLHAENGDVIDVLVTEALAAGHTQPIWHAKTRPAWGAVEAAMRGISLAAQAGASLYIVHMNTAGEVDMLEYARENGLPVMGETCPQYLFFSEDDLERPDGASYICSPPLRESSDQDKLWQGLQTGTIQVISTDHCPFFQDGTKPIQYEGNKIRFQGKELGAENFTKIPNGLPGIGDRLPVLWTMGVGRGRLTPNQFVALHCTNPAKIFGMYPKKGTLLPGSDADLVVWDPKKEITYGVDVARHRTDYNLYQDWRLTGFPEKVFLRGHLIVDNGKWLGRPGMGEFLHRKAGNPIL